MKIFLTFMFGVSAGLFISMLDPLGDTHTFNGIFAGLMLAFGFLVFIFWLAGFRYHKTDERISWKYHQ